MDRIVDRLRRLVIGGPAVIGAMAVLMAATAAEAQTAPRRGAEVWKYLNGLARAERLAVLEREAKREGGFVVYGALGIDRFQEFQGLFNRRYPEVKVEFVRLTGPQVPDKLLLEHRAGRVRADGILSTVDYLDLFGDSLAPYETTTWGDFDHRFRAGSVKEGWTAIVLYITPTSIAWRSDRVSAAEAPKTLDEVMDPKWKGRVGATTGFERFIDALVVSYGEAAAMEKTRRLAALAPRLYRSTAALGEAMGAGEIDLAFNFNADRPKELKEKGAPVDYVFQKPLHGSAVTFSTTMNAEHPFGAALFMEFMTDAQASEEIDRREGIRFFGHTKGRFINKLADFPEIVPFRAIPKERFAELNRISEELFVRK